MRFLRQSFLLPLPQCSGGLVTRLVSAKSLSCVNPLHALPDVAFPPVGRLGLTSPRSTVVCDATTATCPSRVASLVARFPIPCVLPYVCGLPYGLVIWSKPPDHARAFGHPVPRSGHVTRRQMALPSSRATPMHTCPALSPQWGPLHSPKRLRDCCLPVPGNRRLPTTLHFSGLNHAACILAPSSSVRPLLGVHVAVAPDLLARL
jgi:hypothetical protein